MYEYKVENVYVCRNGRNGIALLQKILFKVSISYKTFETNNTIYN